MTTLTPVFPEKFDAALSARILDALAQSIAGRVLERMSQDTAK